MNKQSNIIVYHCNDKKRCDRFLGTEDYMIESKEDGEWLGSGMYFWDNKSNANYWLKEKKRKDKENKEFRIIKGNANLSNILDLTDFETCEMFEELWKIYGNVINRDKDVKLGKKINYLFEHVDFIKDKYDIIKIYGKYNSTPPNNLFKYNVSSKKVQPTLSVKTIYSARKRNCLFDFEYIKSK